MTKHKEAAEPIKAAEPVEPIAAALVMHQNAITLPELTATSPDDVLIVHLARGGQPTTRLQQQVEALRLQARAQRFAPVEVLDDQRAAYISACHLLRLNNPDPGNRSPADWRCAIATLRLTLERVAALTAFLDHWNTLDDRQRVEEAMQETNRLNHRRMLLTSAVVAPPFVLSDFLAGLKGRGIAITSNGSDLAVANANKLTPSERVTLTAQKPGVLALVGAVETI